MGEIVEYAVADGVATLTMDHPPVNALGRALRAALAQAFDRAVADPAVAVIVLAAAGRSWPVGADIREFGHPPVPPLLPELCHLIAGAAKPVVAVLTGAALGGGLELALAAGFRVAAAGAKLGLPEVTLGLLPGAGGTQRLPRLIGAGSALEMMLGGRPVSAARALALGMVDKVAEGDAVAAAQAIARDHISGRRVLPLVSARLAGGAADGAHNAAAYLAAVAEARAKGHPPHDRAAPRIVDCVEAALLLPPEEGFTFERSAFAELMATPEARALRHAFLAERRAARSFPAVAGPVPSPVSSPVSNPLRSPAPRRIAVLGGGAIGAGLTGLLLAAGHPVSLIEAGPETLALALTRVARAQEAALARGEIDPEKKIADWDRLAPGTALSAAAGADLVIDALPEDAPSRARVLAALGGLVPADVPVLSIVCDTEPMRLIGAAGRGAAHLCLYLAEPVRQIGLVEVAGLDAPAPAAVAAAQQLSKALGWRLLRVTGVHGQRLLTALGDAADRCLAAGGAPHEIDRALRSYGLPLGPYEKRDLYGLDHLLVSRPVRRAGVAAAPVGLGLAEWLIGQGRIGRRAGRGYHLYTDGLRQLHGDPDVVAAVGQMRPRRKLMASEIERRVLAGLANDGAWALAEGRVRHPSDIDLVAMAQGFPRWRGGPMQAADEAGLLGVRNDLVVWAAAGDAFWQPAPLWDELIRNGRRFADLNGD